MNPILGFLAILLLNFLLEYGTKRGRERRQQAKSQRMAKETAQKQTSSHQTPSSQGHQAQRRQVLQSQLARQVQALGGKSSHALDKGLDRLSQELVDLDPDLGQGLRREKATSSSLKQGPGRNGQTLAQRKKQSKLAQSPKSSSTEGHKWLEAGMVRNQTPQAKSEELVGISPDSGEILSQSHQALVDYGSYLRKNPLLIEKISLFDQEALEAIKRFSAQEIGKMRLLEVLIWAERVEKILSRYNNLDPDFQAASQDFIGRLVKAQEESSTSEDSFGPDRERHSIGHAVKKGRGHKWRKAIVYQTLLQRKYP